MSRYFRVSLLAMIVIAFIYFMILMGILRSHTNHNRSITVPPLEGLTLKEAKKTLRKKNLRFVVSDSTSFFADIPPNAVIGHSPKAGQKVKVKRKIYLEINRSSPPLVAFPAWKDYPNKRTVTDKIISYGLKVGKTERVTCSGNIEYTDDNYVEALKYNGKPVKEGTMIPKGSKVDIYLCDGFGSTGRIVPDILGMTLLEAQLILEGINLTVGRINVDGEIQDSLSAFVYYQSPSHDGETRMRMGEAVDIYITQVKPEEIP
jgi:beta-lactam-binding protein with PASTA domain